MKTILYLVLVIVLSGCPVYDPPVGMIEVINNSNYAIYIQQSCFDRLPCDPELKYRNYTGIRINPEGDTLPDDGYPPYRISAHSSGSMYAGGSKKKPRIYCKNHIMFFFIIKEETMKEYSWSKICQEQLYEQRIELREEILETNGWKIQYFDEKN